MTAAPPVTHPVVHNAHPPAGTLRVDRLDCLRGDEPVLTGLSFEVHGGEVLQVLGANGSGKTTLLRVLAGLARPDGGALHWRGRTLDGHQEDWRDVLLYVSHAGGVTPTLTVAENLAYAVQMAGRPPRAPLDGAFRDMGLGTLRNTLAGRLSAGQRQRVALARLLLIPAEVWLLDEPLTALDAAGKTLVETLLVGHAARGGLAIVATHQALDLPAGLVRTLQLTSARAA